MDFVGCTSFIKTFMVVQKFLENAKVTSSLVIPLITDLRKGLDELIKNLQCTNHETSEEDKMVNINIIL